MGIELTMQTTTFDTTAGEMLYQSIIQTYNLKSNALDKRSVTKNAPLMVDTISGANITFLNRLKIHLKRTSQNTVYFECRYLGAESSAEMEACYPELKNTFENKHGEYLNQETLAHMKR